MATKTANPGEKIITDNTNLVKIKDTQDKTFKTMSNDSLDLGGGLILSKTDPKYTSLIGKGFTDEQIIKAIGKMDASKIEGVTQKPVETAPKQAETQVQPQTEIKPATQEIKAEQTPAKTEKGPQLLPQSDYLDDSEARQQGIIANLNQAIQTNPQSLKDQKSFREYYNYVGRSDLQKKTLDTWYTGYQKGQELAYKDTNDIYKAYDSGNLSSGDLSNLKIVNPAKYNEVNALIDKKNKLATYSQDLYGVTEQANPFQTIIDNYTKGLQTLATSNFYNDYKEAMNSAGIKEQKLAIADKQTELDQLDKQINEKKREVEKRYEGTGATRGKINAIVADETEDLYSMRSNLVIDMNGAISKYNAEAGAIREDFEMRQAEQQYNMQLKQQQMSELGFAMQLMSYETPAQQDERAWNTFIRQQEYTNGNIYSSDPKTRLRAIEKAVDNTLAEFAGIPMVRSRDQMVNDIKNMVEQGADLGDAITKNIRQPIMNKPEYKVWSANKLGISESALQLAGMNFGFDSNGNVTLKPSISSSEGTGMKGAGARNNNPGNIKDTSFGNVVGKDSKGFAIFATPEDGFDALVEKIKYNQTNTKSKYYGKTIAEYFRMYAPSTDGNNPLAYAQSVANNLGVNINTKISQLDPTKFAAQIAKHDSGYDYSTYNKGGASTISSTLSDMDYSVFNNTTFKPQNIKDATEKAKYEQYLVERNKILSNPEASAEDILKISIGGGDISDTSLQKLDKFNSVLAGLSDISESIEDTNTGPILGIISSNNPYDTKAQALKSQLISITPNLARGVYGEVGVLTDNDIKLYQQTLPNLKQTKDVQRAVLAMTLKTVQRGMENSLKTQARAGKDVSGFIGELKNIQSQVKSIENSLGIGGSTKQSSQGTFNLNNLFTPINTGVGSTQQYMTPMYNFSNLPIF